MSETRIRGQEVSLRLTRNNSPERTITAFRSFTLQYDLEKLSEGYLGETTKRQDEIFNGGSGNFELDPESQDLFVLIDFIKQRAQRRLPVNTSKVNATARFSFPDGTTPRLVLSDMKFGSIPINVAGRESYVSSTFDYSVSDITLLTT